jgi:hypothetical protein
MTSDTPTSAVLCSRVDAARTFAIRVELGEHQIIAERATQSSATATETQS